MEGKKISLGTTNFRTADNEARGDDGGRAEKSVTPSNRKRNPVQFGRNNRKRGICSLNAVLQASKISKGNCAGTRLYADGDPHIS